jgi:signal transduction histidine kinase
MGLPANRGKLFFGVWTGYLIAAGFGALALAAALFDVSPYGPQFALMLAIKVVLNTVVLIALRRGGKGALELMSLNMTADCVLMTGAIYYTGITNSPLLPVYVIEVTVVALLSNVGVTVLTASGILACFTTMCTLVATDVLPPVHPPGLGAIGGWDVVVYTLVCAFVIGTPTFFTLKIVAKLKDREARLEAQSAEVIEMGKQRSVFLASVTHELRTPIHGVQGLADLIAQGVYGPVTEKQRIATASIKRSSQALLHLIDDLLALVRADVGRLEVKPAPVDLGELVDHVVSSINWMLETKRLTLATKVELGEVISDRRLLGHILVNLVANAAKFTPERGHVEVKAKASGEVLTIAVTDTGIGIPDNKRDQIFEAFRQLDPSDERTYGGVGLGLALVKRLCDLLGGTVAVDSTMGKGSTFTVTLPAKMELAPELEFDVPTPFRADKAPAAAEAAAPESHGHVPPRAHS